MTQWQPNDPLSVVENKFCPPHWIFLREFRNGTGFSSTRSADALAVGLYQSRGQWLIAFEQKVSRPDWLRELRNAEKAEEVVKYCDFFNVVVPDRAIVQIEELPQTWGLILVDGKRLKTIKAAPKLKCRPPTRNFMAAVLKRAVSDALKPHLMSDMDKHREAEGEGFERGKLAAARELETFEKLRLQWNEFERRSGININLYTDVERLGEAAKVVIGGGDKMDGVARRLQLALSDARDTVSVIEKHLEVLAARKGENSGSEQGG